MTEVMARLAELVANHEDWLMLRVLDYAKRQGYTRYTSTLAEAWRISIARISKSLLDSLAAKSGVPELLSDEDYAKDPIARFGIVEAQKHRERGVSFGMFLGLMNIISRAISTSSSKLASALRKSDNACCLSIGSSIALSWAFAPSGTAWVIIGCSQSCNPPIAA